MNDNELITQPLADASAHAPAPLRVLIACEESQAECTAFRMRGHHAFSCDIQPCLPKGHPEWHIHGDVTPFLEGRTQFTTQDGSEYHLERWDIIIAHPPCTYLCKVSSVQMWRDGQLDQTRLEKMRQGRDFFYKCLNALAPFVAVENPIPMARAGLPRPSFFACPSWYGVKYTKKTLYWVRNLPPLMAGVQHPHPKSFVRASRGKYRSRTFPQLAQAIAEQWGDYVLQHLHDFDTPTREL